MNTNVSSALGGHAPWIVVAVLLGIATGCGGDDSTGGDGGASAGGSGGSGGANTDGGGATGGASGGTSDASAGTGGSSGSGGGNPDAQTGSCPTGLPGPTLVRVPTLSGGAYCMDATEVTQAQYDVFLKSSPSVSNQPTHCLWNGTYQPSFVQFGACYTVGPKFDPATTPDHPVQCVDWCDAQGYCKWAGKRLCGKTGGGSLELASGADANQSEWFNACSKGGALKYPYGNSYEKTTCATEKLGVQPAADYPKCEGGFSGLLALSGNVQEWEDACDFEVGQDDNCAIRGGFDLSGANATCASAETTLRRNAINEGIGIRCCADLGN